MPRPRNNLVNQYTSASSFRTALEQRLKNISLKEGRELSGLRRRVVFDRFLDRLFKLNPKALLLKGGYALELRLPIARTTKDVDISLVDEHLYALDQNQQEEQMRELLIKSMRLVSNDFFEFELVKMAKTIDVLYGGARFTIQANLGGKEFSTFHVDFAIGDPLIEPTETTKPDPLLSFAGIESSDFSVISREQHFAEKLHIYTRLDLKDNSRVKDLVDMYLLIKSGMERKRLRKAVFKTFERRNTHAMPDFLSPPPTSWTKQYVELARRCKIEEDITIAFSYVNSFVKEQLNKPVNEKFKSDKPSN